jgi:hypothetical protein
VGDVLSDHRLGRLQREPGEGIGAFSTPTVAHCSNVLVLGAIMGVPVHPSGA